MHIKDNLAENLTSLAESLKKSSSVELIELAFCNSAYSAYVSYLKFKSLLVRFSLSQNKGEIKDTIHKLYSSMLIAEGTSKREECDL